ncbi:MAG TPA: isoprenylcysteine carboxylmethyltransferase family protein [Candidatus Acidoferrales bacterium]|nr:isoprenylcysteine carboxylmethyltransferase family protein [Candidatus Acidoferrales bacterium]
MRPLPFVNTTYAVIFWASYILWIIPEMAVAKRRAPKLSSKSGDRGSLLVVMLLLWIGIAADFALSFQLPQAAIRSARVPVFFVGIALMFAGMALRLYSISLLGRYFTFEVAVHTDQPVIEVGPYRYIRHPSYTGALITITGLGLALGNWAGLIALLACIAIAYGYRIPVEESALVAALGEPYEKYIRRTYRLIPYIF